MTSQLSVSSIFGLIGTREEGTPLRLFPLREVWRAWCRLIQSTLLKTDWTNSGHQEDILNNHEADLWLVWNDCDFKEVYCDHSFWIFFFIWSCGVWCAGFVSCTRNILRNLVSNFLSLVYESKHGPFQIVSSHRDISSAHCFTQLLPAKTWHNPVK